MKTATAWVMELGAGYRAATGVREMVHLLPDPELFDIPHAPPHCRQVLVWEDDVLPVVDLAVWLSGEPQTDHKSHACILGYRPGPGESAMLGALLVAGIPKRVTVADDQACSAPEQPMLWRELTLSCFSRNGVAIPILNLAALFQGVHSNK